MRCRVGDVAIVIKGKSAGAVCKCLRLASIQETMSLGYDVEKDGPMWITDKLFQSTWMDWDCLMFDDYLQPIRPQSDDAQDEMLLIAGKPNEVTA